MRLYPNKTHIPLPCINHNLTISYIDDLRVEYLEDWNNHSNREFTTKGKLSDSLASNIYVPKLRIQTNNYTYIRLNGFFAEVFKTEENLWGDYDGLTLNNLYPIVIIALKREAFDLVITPKTMINPDNFDIFVSEETTFASKICKNFGYNYRKRIFKKNTANLISMFSGYTPSLKELTLGSKLSLSAEFMTLKNGITIQPKDTDVVISQNEELLI